MRPVVVVAGDFVRTGGMDRANHALAEHLAHGGREAHLVAHRVEPALAALPGVTWHRVPRPLGSHLLGFPLLARAGRRVAVALASRGPRVVSNGGNTPDAFAVWLHYVHAAHVPALPGRPVGRLLAAAARARALRDERRAVARARVVLANSERTRADAVRLLGADAARVRVVYYGADAEVHRPPSDEERAAARAALGWTDDAPVVAFVGALGDRRKGFDTVLAAWERLAAEAGWNAVLAVVGAGGEAAAWRRRAAAAGLGASVRFLGFRDDVRTVLWASDALVAPARYEAYGLAVQEAICCGLPALVSADAGVAERIDGPLRALLLPDPESAAALAERLRSWHGARVRLGAEARALSATLRARSWAVMGAEVVEALG